MRTRHDGHVVCRLSESKIIPVSEKSHRTIELMFFDLNIPVKKSLVRLNTSKKSKQLETAPTWTATEIADVERRVDVLVHC